MDDARFFSLAGLSLFLFSRGPPRRVSAYEISKSTGFQVDFGFQNGFLDFKVDFGFQNGFLDFKVDFWISKWISGFQSGFLDFKVDFWISKWISGFQSGFQSGFLYFKVDFSRDFWISSEFLDFKADFWISKWISRGISGFKANFWISKHFWISFEPLLLKIQLKYTHDSSSAFLSACMLSEYKVTGTSPLHSAQAACSLIVIHILCDS